MTLQMCIRDSFRTAHASLIYGKGIPKAMAVLDMAIDMDVVKKKGSWLAYKGETLGQGKEKVTQLLEEQPELMEEISREVMGIVAETSGLVNLLPPKSSEDEDTEDRDEDEAMERALLGEEDVLELDVESAD